MSRRGNGVNISNIEIIKSDQRIAIDLKKQKSKEKKANKCKSCKYCDGGFCKRLKTWCSNASRGGCNLYYGKDE